MKRLHQSYITTETLVFRLALFISLLICIVHGRSQYQRCFGDLLSPSDEIPSLFRSTCRRCESPFLLGSSEPRGHIVFILPTWTKLNKGVSEGLHPLLWHAAETFGKGYDVSIVKVTNPSCEPSTHNVRDLIISLLPCDVNIDQNATLHVFVEEVRDHEACENLQHDPCFSSPFDRKDPSNRILGRLLTRLRELNAHHGRPHVLVAESTFVAPTLLSEILRIPLVMVASANDVDLIARKIPEFNGIFPMLYALKNNLVHGIALARMNLLRRSLHLPPLTMPSDYYQQATWVAIPSGYSIRSLPRNALAVSPISTNCVSCYPNMTKSHKTTIIIGPLNVGYLTLRTILRGFIAAKVSLQAKEDLLCSGLTGHNCNLHGALSQVEAVILLAHDSRSRVPKMLPPYIAVENSNLMDCLARHPHVIGIVSHCTLDTQLPAAMGISQICLINNGAYDGRTLAPYRWANVEDVAQAFRSLLQSDEIAINDAALFVNTTIKLIENAAQIEELTLSIKSLHDDDSRSQMPSNSTFARLWSIVLTVSSCTIIIFALYTSLFMRSVRHEGQLRLWRRRYRWIAPCTHDIDPLLLRLSEWLTSPDALHNSFGRINHTIDPSEYRRVGGQPTMVHSIDPKSKIIKRS